MFPAPGFDDCGHLDGRCGFPRDVDHRFRGIHEDLQPDVARNDLAPPVTEIQFLAECTAGPVGLVSYSL